MKLHNILDKIVYDSLLLEHLAIDKISYTRWLLQNEWKLLSYGFFSKNDLTISEFVVSRIKK